MNITLIGYRGTGKSTLGKRLADALQMAFVDSDHVIIERAGKTIKEIFESEGEAGFRDREAAAIRDVAARNNTVIAAGGGAILRPENVAALRSCGKVVWLQADPATLHSRIQSDKMTAATRPNLTTSGGIDEIHTILAKREPLYRAAAHASLDIGPLTIEEAFARLRALVTEFEEFQIHARRT